MDFYKNCWEYYIYYSKHSWQSLAKSIKNFLFFIHLKYFFEEFWTYFHRIIAVTGKRVK